jgi:hypothetical protein
VPDHDWDRRPLLFRKGQELRRKLAHCVSVKRRMGCDPKAVEDRKQQQRVFEWLSTSLSFFDQETRSFRGCLGLRCSMPFDLHERTNKRDLELNLLATQRWRSG